MKKMVKTFLVALLFLVGVYSNPIMIQATDYSAKITLTDFEIYNENGVISETNKLNHNSAFGTRMYLYIDITDLGASFGTSDTATFTYLDFTDSFAAYFIGSAAPGNITSNLGSGDVVVGQWHIEVGSPNRVVMEFNSVISGYTRINIMLDTNLTNKAYYYKVNDTKEMEVKLGGSSGLTDGIWVKGQNAVTNNNSNIITKIFNRASNQQVTWVGYVNSRGIEHMHNPVAGYTFPKDVYFEDNLGAGQFLSLNVYALAYHPMPPAPASGPLTKRSYFESAFSISSRFTRRNDGASYATYTDFKASLQPLEYGEYNDGTNNIFVIYFGDLDTNAELNWTTVFPNVVDAFVADAVSRGIFPAADEALLRAYYNSFYIANQVNGKMINFKFDLNVIYPAVAMDTEIENTATLYYDDTSEEDSASGIMKGLFGTATVAKYEGVLYKTDTSVAGVVLSDATIALEYWDTSLPTPAWVEVETKQTSSSGMVSFPNLAPGRYRFVEITAPSGYDVDSVEFYSTTGARLASSEFVVDIDDLAGHIIRATNTKLVTSIGVSKVSSDANQNQMIEPNENVAYTITVENTGAASNTVFVQDELTDIISAIENPVTNPLTITSSLTGVLTGPYTVDDLMNGITLPIDVNETLTFEFTVKSVVTLNRNMLASFDNIAYVRDKDNNVHRPKTTNPIGIETVETPKDVPDTGVESGMYLYGIILVAGMVGLYKLVSDKKRYQN